MVAGLPQAEAAPELESPESEELSDAPAVKWKQCSDCAGSGDDGKTICETCDGIGSVPRTSVLVDKMREKSSKSRRKAKGGKYRISVGGDDALLLFGRHKDKYVSDVGSTEWDYLVWMVLQGGFPDDLVDVILFHLRKRLGLVTEEGLRGLWAALPVQVIRPVEDYTKEELVAFLDSYIRRRWVER